MNRKQAEQKLLRHSLGELKVIADLSLNIMQEHIDIPEQQLDLCKERYEIICTIKNPNMLLCYRGAMKKTGEDILKNLSGKDRNNTETFFKCVFQIIDLRLKEIESYERD